MLLQEAEPHKAPESLPLGSHPGEIPVLSVGSEGHLWSDYVTQHRSLYGRLFSVGLT